MLSVLSQFISKLVSRQDASQITKYVLFSLVFMMFCAFETSFWPNVIPVLNSPQLWLIFIIYISVRWIERWNLFFIYFLGYSMTLYSMMPLKMAWFSLILTYGVLYFVKTRIHATSVASFSVLTAAISVFYSLIYVGLSHLFETTPTGFMPITRIAQAGLNFVLSFPVFIFLDWLNGFFKASVDVNDQASIQSVSTNADQGFS